MNLDHLFDNLSSVMTVLSFLTFAGILWWTFVRHTNSDFAQAAHVPFDDDSADVALRNEGGRHG